MAGIKAIAQTGEIATNNAKKTLLQILAAANHRVLLKEFSISFKGVSNTATPILVALTRQTNAGTLDGELTLVKVNPSDSETLQTTAQVGKTSGANTGEPTEDEIVFSDEVHPQGGLTWQAPFNGEIVIPGGDRLAIVVTAAADINCVSRMVIEE